LPRSRQKKWHRGCNEYGQDDDRRDGQKHDWVHLWIRKTAEEEGKDADMDNDKAFAIWAVVLIGAVASLLTGSVAAGMATLPSLSSFAEHVTLGLVIRTSYKSFAGPGFIADTRTAEMVRNFAAKVAASGTHADAVS
jgi:hypothetical protein